MQSKAFVKSQKIPSTFSRLSLDNFINVLSSQGSHLKFTLW